VLSFFLVFVWFFAWRIQFSQEFNAWDTAMKAWQICLGGHTSDPEFCGHTPSLNTSVWYGFHFFLATQGIILTLTWGSQKETFRLWSRLCTHKTVRSHGETQKSSKLTSSGRAAEPPAAATELTRVDGPREQTTEINNFSGSGVHVSELSGSGVNLLIGEKKENQGNQTQDQDHQHLKVQGGLERLKIHEGDLETADDEFTVS